MVVLGCTGGDTSSNWIQIGRQLDGWVAGFEQRCYKRTDDPTPTSQFDHQWTRVRS